MCMRLLHHHSTRSAKGGKKNHLTCFLFFKVKAWFVSQSRLHDTITWRKKKSTSFQNWPLDGHSHLLKIHVFLLFFLVLRRHFHLPGDFLLEGLLKYTRIVLQGKKSHKKCKFPSDDDVAASAIKYKMEGRICFLSFLTWFKCCGGNWGVATASGRTVRRFVTACRHGRWRITAIGRWLQVVVVVVVMKSSSTRGSRSCLMDHWRWGRLWRRWRWHWINRHLTGWRQPILHGRGIVVVIVDNVSDPFERTCGVTAATAWRRCTASGRCHSGIKGTLLLLL